MARICKWLVAAAILFGMAPRAGAQDLATSFDQLRVLLKPGDTVTVIDAAGHQTKGKLRSVSSSSLALDAGGTSRVFDEASVRGINHNRHASFGTGAKWGFIVGGGLGALGGMAVALDESASAGEAAGWVVGGAAGYGGFGAAIGVGLAALIRAPHAVYVGRAVTSKQVTVSPVLQARRKGVAVSFAF